jgi:hypothetical protein
MNNKIRQSLTLSILFAALAAPSMLAFKVAEKASPAQGIVAYTKSVTGITTMTAQGNYRITALDPGKIKSHGVCVSTREQPLVTHMNFPSAAPAQRAADYMVKITGLKPLATYYARSYAKVDTGVVYGNVVKFVTLRPEK